MLEFLHQTYTYLQEVIEFLLLSFIGESVKQTLFLGLHDLGSVSDPDHVHVHRLLVFARVSTRTALVVRSAEAL